MPLWRAAIQCVSVLPLHDFSVLVYSWFVPAKFFTRLIEGVVNLTYGDPFAVEMKEVVSFAMRTIACLLLPGPQDRENHLRYADYALFEFLGLFGTDANDAFLPIRFAP